MRSNFLAVRANPKSPRGNLTTLDANVKQMKGHIAAQIATTCQKGQHHPLAIYLANGHEDGYTTFVAFRLIDEFMQKIGERIVTDGYQIGHAPTHSNLQPSMCAHFMVWKNRLHLQRSGWN